MRIANRTVSYEEPPLIIAEIGINHGGELPVAKKMVDLAFASGCEVIKHQTPQSEVRELFMKMQKSNYP